MNSADLRAHWIASDKRAEIHDLIAGVLANYASGLVPQVPRTVVDLAVEAALKAIDDQLSQPVEVIADVVTITDRR